MENESEIQFPANPEDYKLYEEVGEGVGAIVYRALCIPLNLVVAIKVLDLEKCNNDLEGIRHEVQTMRLIDHPNVLRAHCSFTAEHNLWVVMPYMAGGSCLHIMKSAYPEGFREPVIVTLLHQVLKALVYLHAQGHIHRDVKAGNILTGYNGSVKLADFGVSACMFDTGERQRSRNTFVGTPCWMAPEVMQQLNGYDFKADIWSFGITALELAHGHAPFSNYPPMKVLLMILQNAPPGLDYERDKKFSKSFKKMVAACLVKNPKDRPSSEKLLKHRFFKDARSNEYIAQTILHGLPPLGDRFRTLKEKEANFLLQNKATPEDKEQLSQKEYIRGISGWNFNLEELKAQASLIQSPGDMFNSGHLDSNHNLHNGNDAVDITSQASMKGGLQDLQDSDDPLIPVFISSSLQALKKRASFDVSNDIIAIRPDSKDSIQSNSESIFPWQQSSRVDDLDPRKCNGEKLRRSSSVPKNNFVPECQKFSSGSLLREHVPSPDKHINMDTDRFSLRHRCQDERNHSGSLWYWKMKDSHNQVSVNTDFLTTKQSGNKATTYEDSSEGRSVRQKGRFKITSTNTGTKIAPSTYSTVNPLRVPTSPTVDTASVLTSLQFVLHQNALQREQLNKLIKNLEQTSGCQEEFPDGHTSGLIQPTQTSGGGKGLQSYVIDLEQRIKELVEEVQRQKVKNDQLERQCSSLSNKEEEGTLRTK